MIIKKTTINNNTDSEKTLCVQLKPETPNYKFSQINHRIFYNRHFFPTSIHVTFKFA